MNNVNEIIGKNLLNLRKQAKLTQMELAEKFNYSDKSISKWENGESLPSVDVLFELAKFYGVSLNDLVDENFNLQEQKFNIKTKEKKPKAYSSHLMITLLSASAVWLIATVIYVMLMIFTKQGIGTIFLWAVPATCIVLIVFNSIWGHFKYLFPVLSVMLWSTLACLHVQILPISNIWPIYLLGIPLQVLIILWAALVKRPKGYYKQLKQNEKTESSKQENENKK
ncbi:MAG: helix-turn-helix domain-containing protein [Candidatus Onthoplasma sp.]